jgi:hypothetical protein
MIGRLTAISLGHPVCLGWHRRPVFVARPARAHVDILSRGTRSGRSEDEPACESRCGKPRRPSAHQACIPRLAGMQPQPHIRPAADVHTTQIYVAGVIYFGLNCALASISAFLPTIIKTLGFRGCLRATARRGDTDGT